MAHSDKQARERLERREVGEGRFIVREKIGSGSFGDVYIGISKETGKDVAIKLESTSSKHPQLRYEMKILKELQGGVGVAELYYYGVEKYFSVLVISLLGKSLEDLFNHCKRRFSPISVMLLGEQMIRRIEFMHNRNFIHRDIKPDNFLIGRGDEKNVVYIIDFGLSKKFYYPNKGRHIPFREGKNLTGTPRYASINNHHGFEQSRRDDMESIGYVLIYFSRGKLPWQGLKAANKKEKYRKIMQKKERTAIDDLCNGIPGELLEYLRYCKTLKFEEKPDYNYLHGLFQKAIESGKYGDPMDAKFDWIPGAKNAFMDSQMAQPIQPRVPGVAHEAGYSRHGAASASLINRANADSIQRTQRESAMRIKREDEDYDGKYEDFRQNHHEFKINRAPGDL